MKIKIIVICLTLFSLKSIAQNIPPIITNFTIEDDQRARVYFDSSEPIIGSNVTGFILTGNTIIGIKINAGQTTGHYFSVSRPFTFWDNNTIRYEGGSDLINDNSIPLMEFNLEYIDNNISEPEGKGNTYFVSTDGNNNSAGTNISNPWRTIAYAASQATAGDMVYIKAGDYGDETISVKYSGTASNPIKFIGYKENPGDRPTLNRNQNTEFISTEMPFIHTSSKNGSGFGAIDKKYIIIRNLQVEGYNNSVDIAKSSYCIVDNVYVRGGKTNINNFPYYKSVQNRVINSYVSNGSHNGIYMTGARHLIENVYATSKGKPNMDYYIVIVGGNVGIGEHIIRNCEVLRDLSDTHPGHGISLKAQGREIGYSLVENSIIRNVGMSLEARHSGSRNNVYKDLFITNEGSNYGKGIQITSAQNSVFERIFVENKSYGIKFLGSTEDPDAKDAGNNNLIRNCIFNDNSVNIQVIEDLDGQNRVPKNNLIANCIFNAAGSMFLFEANEKSQNNAIINSIMNEIKSEFHKNSNAYTFDFSYSNFYSINKSFWSNKAESGEGNLSKDPEFENLPKLDFRLKSSSPLIDKGKRINQVKSDFYRNSRRQGKSSDIGAFEYYDNSTSSLRANAGDDRAICKGETVTITASGGGHYAWSNGETTQSIEVSPTETTTFEVIVSDGNTSDKDQVIVTVHEVIANAGMDVAIAQGDEVTLIATGGDTYLWSNGETTSSITVDPKATTAYTVTVDKNGCKDIDEVLVTVNSQVSDGSEVKDDASEGVSLVEEPKPLEIQVYPNPTTGILKLESNNTHPDLNIHLINSNGQILYNDKTNSENTRFSKRLDLSIYTKGIYFVRFMNSTQNEVKKVVLI
ncbi:T9SS type A sorting domain-containing protein [Lutimonas vermicola]|uniref:T9SS type A sorting domain-containing protein n=1 Tax=Lutimonas vermicola TaxID=414288 RepID=A0ABU9KZ70_9FLAO